jgi:hypothetical protein
MLAGAFSGPKSESLILYMCEKAFHNILYACGSSQRFSWSHAPRTLLWIETMAVFPEIYQMEVLPVVGHGFLEGSIAGSLITLLRRGRAAVLRCTGGIFAQLELSPRAAHIPAWLCVPCRGPIRMIDPHAAVSAGRAAAFVPLASLFHATRIPHSDRAHLSAACRVDRPCDRFFPLGIAPDRLQSSRRGLGFRRSSRCVTCIYLIADHLKAKWAGQDGAKNELGGGGSATGRGGRIRNGPGRQIGGASRAPNSQQLMHISGGQ